MLANSFVDGGAGIRPVMITGDHPLTAQAVARELGLLKNGRVVTGAGTLEGGGIKGSVEKCGHSAG